ncbi:MAG: hypothetical protein VKJ46_11150 [Leptolyngbyaceae bacterium]|nr:hypothetical protein [Leptolyngbyaceae bacterium]
MAKIQLPDAGRGNPPVVAPNVERVVGTGDRHGGQARGHCPYNYELPTVIALAIS